MPLKWDINKLRFRNESTEYVKHADESENEAEIEGQLFSPKPYDDIVNRIVAVRSYKVSNDNPWISKINSNLKIGSMNLVQLKDIGMR